MTGTRKVVGVLGGMGPEATILLQERLLACVAARDDADHLPLLIDMNPQVPSRIAHLIDKTGTDPGPVLAEMAMRLETAGATALAMPCNTAHHYATQIEAAVSIPLLNMVDLAVDRAARSVPSGSAIGILASPATRLAGVFDAALARAGLSALWPEDSDRMLTAIRAIKARRTIDVACQTLTDAAHDLSGRGAALILVGCSEFSLFAHRLPAARPVIDTLDALVDAIRDHTLTKAK